MKVCAITFLPFLKEKKINRFGNEVRYYSSVFHSFCNDMFVHRKCQSDCYGRMNI